MARPRRQKKQKKTITYRRISKRLAVETTSLLLFMFYFSIPSLLKSKHAISIICAEMHADHVVSSGSPHNGLHFSSYYHYTNLTFVCVCVCVCVYERKGHRKLFDPSLKSRFLCIAALRRYKSSRLKQLATALAKY